MAGKLFGGKGYDFTGHEATMEEVFGTEDISPLEMTSKLWEYIRENNVPRVDIDK